MPRQDSVHLITQAPFARGACCIDWAEQFESLKSLGHAILPPGFELQHVGPTNWGCDYCGSTHDAKVTSCDGCGAHR